MSPSYGCFLSFFSDLSGSASLSPHLRLPVHVTLRGFFPPSPSFLPVSSPFYSVDSYLSGRPAVLVQEGQKVGIFAEFVGSELLQELGVWPLPDWGHKVGVVPSELHAGPCCSSSQNSVTFDAGIKERGIIV